MARGLISNTVSTRNGTLLAAETTGNATDNHYFNNTGRTKLHVRNSGATPRIVTIYVSKTVAGQAVTPITKSIAAATTQVFGPYNTSDFGDVVNVDVAHAELMLRTVD